MNFVTREDDANGLAAVGFLATLGYSVKVLAIEAVAEKQDVALFTPLEGQYLSGKRGRYLRISSVKLSQHHTPQWAWGTDFRVAVLRTKKSGKAATRRVSGYWGFEAALSDMAESYKNWLMEGSQMLVPWIASMDSVAPGSACHARIEHWLSPKHIQEFRNNFMIKPSVQKQIHTVKVGQWDVNYCNQPFIFPASAAQRAIKMLAQWQLHFASEQTWVQSEIGVPSLFVRFDCIVRDNELVVYEIEERPAGIGVSSFVNEEFRISFRDIAKTWPEFRVEISPLRRATDDHLWVERMGWQNTQSNLVLVRAEPEELQFHRFEPFSVSSLKAKGNKSYGIAMGLWKKVASADELPWDEAFVIKPMSGSKVRDLEFWDPQYRPGSSIRSKVEAELKKQGNMFLQLLHPPMETGIKKFPWMIFRIFFGFNPQDREWVCLGGNWNARHNLRIHGASDAIFGPAVVE